MAEPFFEERTGENVSGLVVLGSRVEAEKFLLDYVQRYHDDQPDDPIALDFETTALSPADGKIRLTAISAGSLTCVIDHFYAGKFADYYDILCEVVDKYYVFNAKFEGFWFDFTGEAIGSKKKVNLFDIAFMRKVVMGGGPLSLRLMAKWDFDYDMDKELQDSNWSQAELTVEQYTYSGTDAWITRELARHWQKRMEPHHWRGFNVLNEAWRATVEAEQTGFCLDVDYHEKLVHMWARRRETSERAIRKFVSWKDIPNLQSKKQISDFFKRTFDEDDIEAWPKTAKTHQLDTSRTVLNQFSYRLPYPASRLLAAFMVYNRATKYLTTYGEKLINCHDLSGRIYVNFNIAQAVTGRFSSSGAMNAQNYPNNPKVRRSFISIPGHKLVIADYKSIELRILAEMAGDDQLRHDVIYGDPHSASAIDMFRYDADSFYEAVKNKEPWAVSARRSAKAFSFQLTYGAGPATLATVLRCSDDDASEYIKRWADRYRKAYNFRFLMSEKLEQTGYLPCQSGRTIYVPRKDRGITVASNYPIQGSGADVLYRAMAHLVSMLDREGVNARLVGVVHDEILMEASNNDAERAEELLCSAMVLGWLDIFPGTDTNKLVESAIGTSWADKA